MVRSRLSPALWLLALPAAALAQAPAPASPQDPSPLVLRSTTRLIQVDVVVRDKAGRPVPGLGQGDFEIFEDGRRQAVRFFSAAAPRPARDAELPPGMVSNRAPLEGSRQGVTVILVDSLNTDWRARNAARENLRKFLLAARPDDRIALYTLGGSLKIVHEFTTDARSVLKQLESRTEQPNFGDNIEQISVLKELIPECAALLKWSLAREGDFRDVQRAVATFDTLQAIARHLGSTPTRKSLIWISSGFPMSINANANTATMTAQHGLVMTGEHRSFTAEFDQAYKALSAANVAVYPIDPRGLMGLPEFDAISRKPEANRPWVESNSMLQQMAQRTGGRAFIDQNDILGSLKQVTDEAQQTYTLAYYPSSDKFDGRYRKLEVRLKREGLAAAHRQGYYALDEKELKQADPAEAMRAAAREPLDSAVIGIDAALNPQPGTKVLELLARIDAAELLWPEGSGFTVAASVAVFQFDAEGRQLAGVSDNLSFAADPAKAALLSQHGLSFRRGVELNPAAARVRLVVRSARTGATGTLTVPLPPAARP